MTGASGQADAARTRRRPVIGVMGPGESATALDVEHARRLGELIAGNGWITLTGGRAIGVMDAALQGARSAGGLTVGVLPGRSGDEASASADLCVVTGLGEGRNLVNVLTSDVVVVCGLSAGTASEVALALTAGRHVVLVAAAPGTIRHWTDLGGPLVHEADAPAEAVARVRELLGRGRD